MWYKKRKIGELTWAPKEKLFWAVIGNPPAKYEVKEDEAPQKWKELASCIKNPQNLNILYRNAVVRSEIMDEARRGRHA